MLYKSAVAMSSGGSGEKIATLIHRLKRPNLMSGEKIATAATTVRHSGGESSSVWRSPSGGRRRHYSPRSKIDKVEIATRGKSPSGKSAFLGEGSWGVSRGVAIVASVDQVGMRTWFKALGGYWVEERG